MVSDFSLFLFLFLIFLLLFSLLQANNSVVELIAQYFEYQRVAESYELVAKDLKATRNAAVSQAKQLQADLKS